MNLAKISNSPSYKALLLAVISMGVVSTSAFAQVTVLQEWNFTGGSLLSENGTNATFLGTVADTDGNDQYNVTRGNGNSGSVLLGTTVTSANADLLTVSVTLADFNFSNLNDEYFGVRFRSGTTTISDLRFDAQTAADSGSTDRMRLTGTAVAGVALNTTVSATPITYGLTLNFSDDTYTYWIGTPESDNSTWVSRFLAHTGSISLSSVSIDNLQWSIQNYGAGNSFNLDQILVTSTLLPVPEPSVGVIVGLGALAMVFVRRRRHS